MRLTKNEFYAWKNFIEQRLELINRYESLFDDEGIYKLGYRGKRRRLCLLHGDKVIVYKIKDIDYYVELLVKRYVRR